MRRDTFTERTTTLASLGIDTPDVSGSLKAPLIIAKKKYGQETVYLAHVDRPVAGSSLAHLINSLSKVTPYMMGDSSAIVGDLPLPEQARAKYASEAIKQRDARHRNSFIGPAYSEIDQNHRQRWLNAFKENPEPVREISAFLTSLHDRHIDYLIEDSKKYRTVHDDSGKPASWLTFITGDLHTALGDEKYRKMNMMIGDQLTPDEIKAFILASDHSTRTVVDFNTGQVFVAQRYSPKSVTISPPNKLNWNTKNWSYSINANFQAHMGGADMNWSLDNYVITYGERYDDVKTNFEQAALTPLIGWTTDPEGRRKYIPQTKVKAMKWHNLPDHADVLLGRVLAAALTPGITDIWQDQMPLKKDGEKNDIGGAQALILASLPQPNFGGRVLRDPDGILAKIEAGLAA